ncbi:hypothetical protein [Saccharococcus thermophilus]|uniref:Uncharacterized protein n=1 Tax=Saccharococcus thermophilus TaxID=29396 RepID=A0A846MK23_9BACL|nr:hypothetical protein [Saccharococcus thermophilus]NIK15977.1 hypothetical protein [Saccharococcus thermophilus]
MLERGRNDHPHDFHFDGEREGILNDALATEGDTLGVRSDIDPLQLDKQKNPFHVAEVNIDEEMKQFRSIMDREKRG